MASWFARCAFVTSVAAVVLAAPARHGYTQERRWDSPGIYVFGEYKVRDKPPSARDRSPRVGGSSRGAGSGPVRISGDMQAYAPMAHPTVVAQRDAMAERVAKQTIATEARINVARQTVAELAGPLAAAFDGSRALAGRTIVPSYRRGRLRGSGEAPDIGGLLGAIADQLSLYRGGRENRRMNEALDDFARSIPIGTVVQVKVLFVNREYRSVYPAARQVWLGDGFMELGPFTIIGTQPPSGCGGANAGPVNGRPGRALLSCR